MAMLPVLLDMVDEIYNSLDDQSKNFQDSIPLLFVPQRAASAGPGMRCRRGPMAMRSGGCGQRLGGFGPKAGCPCPNGPATCQKKKCQTGCQRGACCVKKPTDGYEVTLSVKSFKPEEVSVKVKDHEIIIEGKHEERQDDFGFVSRQFTRRYILPKEFDPDTISTFLNAEGKMTIKALKPQPAAVETNERVIPIQFHVETLEPLTVDTEQGWEKVDETEKGETSDLIEEDVRG
jgi:hypothetical protein